MDSILFFYWTGFTGFFGLLFFACFQMKQATLNRLRRKNKISLSVSMDNALLAFIWKAGKIYVYPVNPV